MTDNDHTLQTLLLGHVSERTSAKPRVRRLASGHDAYMSAAKEVCAVRAFYYEAFSETVVEVITRTKPSAMPNIERFRADGHEFPIEAADRVAGLLAAAT